MIRERTFPITGRSKKILLQSGQGVHWVTIHTGQQLSWPTVLIGCLSKKTKTKLESDFAFFFFTKYCHFHSPALLVYLLICSPVLAGNVQFLPLTVYWSVGRTIKGGGGGDIFIEHLRIE